MRLTLHVGSPTMEDSPRHYVIEARTVAAAIEKIHGSTEREDMVGMCDAELCDASDHVVASKGVGDDCLR